MTCPVLSVIAIVGWIIVIIGYAYTNNSANSRETRKEVRNEIDRFLEELDKLLDSSHTYHCSSEIAARTIAHSKIHISFNTLDGIKERLENYEKEYTLDIQKYFNELFEEITGGNFGSSDFAPNCAVYAEKSKVLSIKAENIRTNCENWFKHSFQE